MNTTTESTTTLSPCIIVSWSADTMVARTPTLVICLLAVPIHVIFWIHLLFYPSVRQKGMIWLYIYLLSDLFLIFRFLLFYGQRVNNVCISRSTRIYLCYFEAVSKLYITVLQSYILLGLNICRYVQIVRNRNVYIKNIRLVILALMLIFSLPGVNIVFQFLINWTVLWRKLGSLCDIIYASAGVQVYNLIVIYTIPVALNILFLGLCIRFLSSTGDIRSLQILHNRRKFHRTILKQSLIFYTIWTVLWSPYVLSFQFVNSNSLAGIFTALLNYVQVAIDPAIVAVIDVRFMRAWKNTCGKVFKKKQGQVQPTTIIGTVTARKH